MEMRFRLLQGREIAPRAILANASSSENPRTLGSCALAWRCRLTALAVRQARRAPDAPAGLARRYSRHARQDIPGELPGAEKFQRRSRSVGGGRRTPAFAASRSPQRLAGGCNGSRSVGFHRFHCARARRVAFRAALRGAPRRCGSAVWSARKAITRALHGAPPKFLALAFKRLPRE